MVKVKLFLKSNTIPLTLSFGLFFLTFLGTIVFELWKNGFIINSDPSIINEIDISQKPVPWNEIFIHNFVILTPILLGILNLGLLSFFYLILQGYLLGVSIGARVYYSKSLKHYRNDITCHNN